MPKTKISDYSSTASNNTDVDGINIAEGMAPSNVNNAMREIMAHLKDWQAGNVAQDMKVDGAFTCTGNAVLSADVSVGDDLTVTGDATVGGGFTCTGAAILSSNLTVGGAATITGNLAANGTSSLGATTFSGAVVMSSSLAISGAVTKQSNNAYLLKGVVYLASGTATTYTTPTGVRAIEVTVIGGGGGGGGGDGTATSNAVGPSGAGGGGGFATALIENPASSYVYTVGSGGSGGAAGANNGTAGGTTEFKNSGATVVISATGGSGGSGQTIDSSVTVSASSGGVGSITGSVSSSLVGAGTRSSYGRGYNGVLYTNPVSGFCPLIGGGVFTASSNTNGINASNYGEGGSGANINNVTTNYAGGNGFGGLIIIREYY